jgi:hypothetical protein
MDEDEFARKYEAHEAESIEDCIAWHSATEADLRDTISY